MGCILNLLLMMKGLLRIIREKVVCDLNLWSIVKTLGGKVYQKMACCLKLAIKERDILFRDVQVSRLAASVWHDLFFGEIQGILKK